MNVCARIAAVLVFLGLVVPIAAAQDAPASRPAAPAPEKKTAAEYVRFRKLDADKARLETAIATFEDAEGRRVDLIGAVHIGDRAYYKRLNERFKDYESVLYEMVKPEGMTVVPKTRGEASGLSAFQQGLGRMLGLSFQLDGIDYNAPNFVHADMTAERLSEIMDERHINTWSIIVDVFIESLRNAESLQGAKQPSVVDLVKVLFAEDRARQLKLAIGPMMGDVEQSMGGLGKTKIGRLIVEERNDVALKFLDERLQKGEKKIGVFYGAAHLDDMANKLLDRGFKKTNTQWMAAWRVDPPQATSAPTQEKKGRV